MTTADETTDRLAEWWQGWWREDFSWAGLARRSWEGWSVRAGPDGEFLAETDSGARYGTRPPFPFTGEAARPQAGPVGADDTQSRPATLQDYWRADPVTGRLRTDAEMGGELEKNTRGQPVFHRVHLPLTWQDGTPTGKADWLEDALDALTKPRLLAAAETVFRKHAFEQWPLGGDKRAQFVGGVWLKAPFSPAQPQDPLSVSYFLAHFARDVHFSGIEFAANVQFERSSFAGNAGFNSARFNSAHFNSAHFAGDTSFGSARFAGVAAFFDAKFGLNGGNTDFGDVTFSDIANFTRAAFHGPFGFERARFLSLAKFAGVDLTKITASDGWRNAFRGGVVRGLARLAGGGYARGVGVCASTAGSGRDSVLFG